MVHPHAKTISLRARTSTHDAGKDRALVRGMILAAHIELDRRSGSLSLGTFARTVVWLSRNGTIAIDDCRLVGTPTSSSPRIDSSGQPLRTPVHDWTFDRGFVDATMSKISTRPGASRSLGRRARRRARAVRLISTVALAHANGLMYRR